MLRGGNNIPKNYVEGGGQEHQIYYNDSQEDLFICTESNERNKLSNEPRNNSNIRLRWFYDLIKPFEESFNSLLEELIQVSRKITLDFDFIMQGLSKEIILEKKHIENRIFCEKYLKRYSRILGAMKQLLPTCREFYVEDSDNSLKRQSSRIEKQQSKEKIRGMLDDVLPFFLVQLHKAIDKERRKENNRKQSFSSRKSSEEFSEAARKIKKRLRLNDKGEYAESISINNTKQSSRIEIDNYDDNLRYKNLGQFDDFTGEIRYPKDELWPSKGGIRGLNLDSEEQDQRGLINLLGNKPLEESQNRFPYAQVSAASFEEELNQTVLQIKRTVESFEQFCKNWRGIVSKGELTWLREISDNVLLDKAVMKANIQEYIEARSISDSQQMVILSSLNDPTSQLFTKIPLSSLVPLSTDFQTIKDAIGQLYGGSQRIHIFCFDEDYQPVNTVAEQHKVKIIKILTLVEPVLVSTLLPIPPGNSFIENSLTEGQLYQDISVEQMKSQQEQLTNGLLQNNTHNDVLTQVEQTMILSKQNGIDNLKPIVVGISGSTRSGKGTLCSHLQIFYGAKHICQDSFFDYEAISGRLGGNAECKEAIDWDKFLAEINAEMLPEKKNQVILIEGFQVFSNIALIKLCDVKIFLDISEDSIYERRMATKPVKESYFWKYLIKEYALYRQMCINHPEIAVFESSAMEQFPLYFLSAHLIQSLISPDVV